MIWLVALYFGALLAIGYRARGQGSVEEYFLAGRGFGKTVLFFTMIATNFSAFFFLGFAGAAYSKGLSQYALMAVGTALMPIMFLTLGERAYSLGKAGGFVTMPELVGATSGSHALRMVFLIVLCAYTLPYLGVQAVGAGYIIESLTGYAALPASVLVLGIITFYVLLGGMRGSGWTDLVQGVIMFIAMAVSLAFVAWGLGGPAKATAMVAEASPELLQYPDIGAGLFALFSFTLLWVFVDPMFPHLFTRFFTAAKKESIYTAAKLYPLVVAPLFAAPVIIGVWARGAGIEVDRPDMVLIRMVESYAPEWAYGLVMVGALAALMSTADSQMLSLSTMLARDLGLKRQVTSSKAITVGLFAATSTYLIFGFDPQAGIFATLLKTTFAGLAVLFPTVWAVIYHRPKPFSCLLSIFSGQAAIAAIRYELIPNFAQVEGVSAIAIACGMLILAEHVRK